MRNQHLCALATLFALISSLTFAQDQRRRSAERAEGPPRPEELDFRDGVAVIPDRATYEKLSYQGNAGRDAYLNDIQFVKFQIEKAGSDEAQLYFMNTKTYQAHPRFMQAIGLRGGFGRRRGGDAAGPGRQMRGAIAYRPRVRAPDGQPGVYTFDFQPNDSFPLELIKFCQDLLLEKAPFLKGKLVYHPLRGGLDRYEREKAQYGKAGVVVYLDDDLEMNLGYLPLNRGVSFGRLRLMERDEFPTSRDIVLYASLPNELPRVAGIITGVRQTPLSHVNLRAIQDNVPNAFVTGAASHEQIRGLIGKQVRYEVTADGFTVREATPAEVDAHFADLRPARKQTPPRDLSVTRIRPLEDIEFGQSSAFGVKTANLAAMRKFKLSKDTFPDGYAVPFYFYDSFMKHNGLYRMVEAMLAEPAFQNDREHQQAALKTLQTAIRRGDMPDWMFEAIGALQSSMPAGAPIRCRSSTNNEDLPGFSGAGLYGSYTHGPGEGHLASTIKQVFASLWSDRAFEERDFYRVDHLVAAMGVLVHPSYKEERANGVAVTTDVLYERQGYYYINAQVGDDLVTNPEGQSVPEEVLLGWWEDDGSKVMQYSNRVTDDQRVLQPAHLATLRKCLGQIHGRFASLYGVDPESEGFAMEVEFKITKDNALAIKQARPWVFSRVRSSN